MINFTSKLVLDKTFYQNLKHSDKDAIIKTVAPVVETSGFTILSGVDEITLTAKKSARGDYLIIKYDKEDIDISTKGEVTPQSVLHQILLYTCIKNGKTPRTALPKHVMQKLNELIEEFKNKQK